ncbi:MAG: hypothetical protein WKF75_10600, partial [Singulisphaera sp.]
MPRDQHAVLGQDEVGLDEVGARLGRQAVARQGMLGPAAGEAPVADDQWPRRRAHRVVDGDVLDEGVLEDQARCTHPSGSAEIAGHVQRLRQADEDELVVIRLARRPAGAEREVVVVQHADRVG